MKWQMEKVVKILLVPVDKVHRYVCRIDCRNCLELMVEKIFNYKPDKQLSFKKIAMLTSKLSCVFWINFDKFVFNFSTYKFICICCIYISSNFVDCEV